MADPKIRHPHSQDPGFTDALKRQKAGKELTPDDERLLATVEVETVEIETISGPRVVTVDALDTYADVIVESEESA